MLLADAARLLATLTQIELQLDLRGYTQMTPPKRIVLNALYLAPNVSGGPETYLRGLAPALATEFPETDLTVVSTPSGTRALRADGWEAFASLRALPGEDGERLRRQWAEQVLLPRLVKEVSGQVVHSLASVAPLHAGARSVVTLHDVTFLGMRTFGKITTYGMGFVVGAAARRADALITATEAARDEICSVLGVDSARLTVIPHAYQPAQVVEATSAEDIRLRYELDGARVVLCVAAKRPHKNQELLIRAMPLLPTDTVLVLAGHPEPYERELRELVHELNLDARVRFVGFVPPADLEALWRLAGCAAFPTLGEGFGIPVIEALGHGVPVAASRIPVLREVGGDLPHYFDPHDATEAADAITDALSDTATRDRGPGYVSRFSWQTTAQETYEVYERVMAGRD